LNNHISDNFTIIIPTLHSSFLSKTIQALQGQTAFYKINEILVVGQEVKAAWMQSPKVRYIHVENDPTPAHNRNIGAGKALSKWICFIDADCSPNPDWLERMAEKTIRGKSVLAGAVDVPDTITYWGLCDHYFGFENTAVGYAAPVDILRYAPSINFCILKELFIEMGGFNEAFKIAAGEDWEFCQRLVCSGHSITFVPDAIVIHNHSRQDLQSAWRHCYNYGEALVSVWKKSDHNWLKYLRPFIEMPLIGELGGLLRIILRGIIRTFRHTILWKHLSLLPGIMILDWAHTLGVIHATRKK